MDDLHLIKALALVFHSKEAISFLVRETSVARKSVMSGDGETDAAEEFLSAIADTLLVDDDEVRYWGFKMLFQAISAMMRGPSSAKVISATYSTT